MNTETRASGLVREAEPVLAVGPSHLGTPGPPVSQPGLYLTYIYLQAGSLTWLA